MPVRALRGWVHGLRRIVTADVGARPRAFGVPGIPIGNRCKRSFSEGYGCCSGVLWLVMGVGEWLGGEVRSGKSWRCALACGVHGLAVGARRDTS